MLMLPRFVSRMRELWARASQPVSQVRVNLIDMWQAGRPLPSPFDVKRFGEEGYRRNVIIFACVTQVATSLQAAPLYGCTTAADGTEKLLPANHMLARLLARPNPDQDSKTFSRVLATHNEVAGNYYILKRRNGAGMPVELRLLQPDLVQPVPDRDGNIEAWTFGRGVDIQTIPAADIIHGINHPDPLDPYRGLSPIAVLARMGDLDNNAADFLAAFFLNAGIPSGLLKYKEQVGPDERQRTRGLWREKYSGKQGWHDIAILDGDVEYEEIGSKLRTLDLAAVFGQTESRICAAHGVPPILVGAWIGLVNGTYSNYESARESFYEETMVPKWESVGSTLTMGLAPEFGAGISIGYDLSEIDALQDSHTETRDFALKAWDSGLATRNEARALVGWPEVTGEDGTAFNVKQQAPGLPAPPATMQRLLSGETFDAVREAQWRALHHIADAAAPNLKKNSSGRSRRPRVVLH